jgi:signal transduction histidine kinase
MNWKYIRPGIFSFAGKRISETDNFHKLTREDQDFLKKEVQRLDRKNPPLELVSEDKIIGYFHYGEIRLINFLAWMPLLEFIVFCLFIFFGYYGYYVLRSGEQSLLWAALAKETAHQMGTPLSSLMGWMELLKQRISSMPSNRKYLELTREIDGDISRLTKVSIRFSQIGSLPKLKKQSINNLVQETVDYFSHRLPQLSKKININLTLNEVPDIWINKELLGWVLENLIKNALDSIKEKQGFIEIETHYAKVEKTVHLITTDNGLGIVRENWKKVFQTGFSTKKRGWGLGLSLARRIITIYHEGVIFVEWSSKYHGTQIRIILPLMPQRIRKEISNEWKKTDPMGG